MKTKKMPGKRPMKKMPKKGKKMITALAVMSAFALSGCASRNVVPRGEQCAESCEKCAFLLPEL